MICTGIVIFYRVEMAKQMANFEAFGGDAPNDFSCFGFQGPTLRPSFLVAEGREQV